MISKNAAKPEQVHRSAAVDLGDIVVQAASALRANRGIVRVKPGFVGSVNVADRGVTEQKSSRDRFNLRPVKKPAKKASGSEFSTQARANTWQKSAPDPEKLTPQHAYLRAIALLCGRDYSSKKLAEKLAKLSFASEAIEVTLVRLRLEGALSDARFAASRTNGLINRGKGPRAIQAKLKEAGLAKELIAHSLDELEIDWTARARTLLNRKFGDTPTSDRKDWAKRARFLIARGFDEASVRNALKPEKS